MKITDEQIEKANFVNLPSFLMRYGFELKKAGTEYIWKDHNSVNIKDNSPSERGKWYRFSTQEGGDNIAFVRKFMDKSFVEAVGLLNDEVYDRNFSPEKNDNSKLEKVQKSDIIIAENADCKRVFAYLCKTRGLDYDMISELMKSGKIAQEQKTGNVVFKVTDENNKVVGAEKVGTSTLKKFKGIATGSASGYGFEFRKGNGENLLFFESSIDLLSYLQMKNPDNCRLVSMMGVKPNIVIETMKRYGISPENVFICSDNDNAGNKFFQRLKTEFPQINRTKPDENFKDWNDMLRKIPMQKETEKMVVYGNKIWNDATDNRDKTLVSMPENEFEKMRNLLNNSGMNYFAYSKSGTVVMAVNDKDLNWLKQISGNENLFTKKSDVSYIPPQKNIIGNAEYRYIPDKNFISCDRDTALKMAEIMAKNNIQFSGRIYPSGKATLTVSGADFADVQAIQQNVVNMRKQFVKAEKADEIIGNKAYRDIQNKHFYYSKLSHEQYQKIKPFIDTNVHYSGLIRNGKVTFTVEKEDSAMFLRALENAQREGGIIEKLQENGLDNEHIGRLSAIIHRFAVDDIHESLDNFFTPQLDENQFSKMISLVNEYLSQSASERYGEFSGLNKILDFKNEIDRNSELNEFFVEHNFSDAQKSAISEMFAEDDSVIRLNVIDETFLPEEIYDYYDILHNHLEASDVTIFLENRREMAVEREKVPEFTPKEKAFLNGDILPFMSKSLLAWDEIEDLGYRLFEEGYNDKYAPHENASFGNGLSENRLSVLARRMQNGEDIRKDLTLGLLGGQNVFTTNHDNKFTAEYGENSITARYGNAERNISYEDLGDVFLSLIKSEYDGIVHDRTVEDLQDNIPDITVETADNLISAFENAVTSDWKGDEVKEHKIKSALYDILSDEEKTEKAFISIADMKYNFKVETEKESPIHFGLLGNGITAYDISRTDKETNDYVTVAHISLEGVVKIYDDSISEEDMSKIQQEADSAREKFMTDWEKLDTISQFQKLYDRADTETMLNIGKENLSTEEKIQKYMPFVFFGEGERPQPVAEIAENLDISENKGSWFVHTNSSEDGIKNGIVGRKINPDGEISGRNMEYCSGLFTDDNEQGFNIEFAQKMADLLNKNGISDLHEARNFIDNEIVERDDFSDISTEKIDISADSEFIQQVVRDVEELQISDDEDISVVHDITFLGDNSKFDAVKAVINTESFGTTFVDGDRLSVVIYDDADINDVRQLIETAMDNEVYLNVSSSNFLESRFGDDFLEINSPEEVNITSDIDVSNDSDDKDVDKPLFTDENVIEEIEKSENSTDNRPFWEIPDISGEQLSMFGDSVPLSPKRQSEPKKEKFADGLFVGNVNRFTALHDEIIRGTGFQDGKLRVQKFYDEKKPTNKEFADFLKHEYGTGGHSGDGEIYFVDHDAKGMFFTHENGEKFKFTWSDVAEMTAAAIEKSEYIGQKEKSKNLENNVAEEKSETVEIGDKFRNKMTGEISEVVSLSGALPYITDDCTVKRESDGFAITGNISYEKLLDENLYEYIGRGNVEEKTDISEKTEMSDNILTHNKDIPVYKGEWKIADNKELYKDIVTENKRFAEMAKSVIGNGKNPADGVKALTEKFGFERTAWLTALNIVAHPLDDRFYPMDKEWACKVLTPHFEIQPDELFRQDTEKSSTFDRLISGGTLYDMHNTHLAQFAETFIPEYEKYLEKAVAVEKTEVSDKKLTVLSNSSTHDKNIHTLSDKDKQFLADYPQIPMPTYSPWGTVQECTEIAHGAFEVSTAGHGGIIIADDLAEHILSDKAREIGFVEDGWHCFEEDADAQIPLREMLDKGIMDKEKYFAEKYNSTFEEKGEWFNKVINDSISAFHPDYWSAYTAEQVVTSEQLSKNSDNFTITDDKLGNGSAKSKFKANIEAIKTLKTLEKENRPATDSEKETLSKYVGWGGIPQAFDSENKAWNSEFSELKSLLTDKEYSSARASTLDAFFTSPTVIDGIYQALENFGFEGGNVLEPSCGVGNFFGKMPDEMRENSKLYGVEIDSISGRIAQKLYPDADIAIQGFEKNNFQNGGFDVVVGNVPFGELSFKDDIHGTTKLHDYFFAEALEKVKNGGILAFVTSAGTLDKRDESTRKMLADKADFIGAVRLPGGKNGAFKENAGTEVTTDIIFLQKNENKNSAEIPDWVHIGETVDGLPINQYFAENPDMVLGKVVEGNKLYGTGTMVIADENSDLSEQLKIAVSKLSATISDEKARDVYAKSADGEQLKIPSNLRNYSFFEQDNKIYFKTANQVCHCRFDTKNSQFQRAKAFINLRDLTRELIEAQELNKSDDVIKNLQSKLTFAYDNFYKKYGLIHSQSNKRYFSDDVSYNLVAGLEKKYDKTKLIEKSDIFTKRTIQPPKAIEHVETAIEALTLSVAEKAGVDFDYMSSLTGMTEDELKHDLQGEIFKIPHSENTYQTASEYLSGDIREKLNIAEEIAEYDADFAVNVNALKATMPEPLKAGDIDVKIGATWLDPKYYEQFMYELFQTPRENRADVTHYSWQRSKTISAEYSEHSGTWHIDNKSADSSVITSQQFGTKKMNAYEIMEHLLNLKEPKVYKTIEVPDGMGDVKEKRVVDIDATKVVQRKADKIKAEFKKWIFKDSTRREEIVGKYNELFNSVKPREYDGSALQFPMMNTDIKLHEHQKNAIAHAFFGGNTLFAHSVGAGKTFEMIATAMESKRLGLCTKSLFAVPNHLTEQIGDDFQKLYPSANILVATKKDFQKENRQQLFAKIATGNFDAIIIGHSQLGMIPISKERQETEIKSQIDDMVLGIAELKASEGSKFQVKAMERTKKSLEKQLAKLEKNHDDTITFEQLGVDKLFIDEAHEFKNCAKRCA